MSKEPKEYLRHIQDECRYIISVSKELQYEDFLEDETLKRAVVRSLEIIGEAVSRILKIKSDFKLENAKNIIGTRNRIIHSYDNISDEVVWAIVCRELPDLKLQVEELLNSF